MKVVSPYRPFAPESTEHKLLGPFDWVEALRMLAISVERSNQCETLAITDVDTDLPVPALQFVTTERRLMLWILDVSLRYLESDHFDQDTVMICPDVLVYGDISRFFNGADLGLIVRPEAKYAVRPVLNGVQLWSVAGKDRLIAFFRDALVLAKTLSKKSIRWGADTVPLAEFVSPIETGIVERHGLMVDLIGAKGVLESLSLMSIQMLKQGRPFDVRSIPFCDFRYLRKHYMSAVFEATIGRVTA